ncbi:carbon monoxide dehydrogenase subunit G [Deinococcus sp.]|uniref:CoxG family protein n=1 Tax=Deinococcus sp. TaxID=47478 RepID=UPI0025D89C64|nr:carbon monoxide dehydrogenase subunit G [Deinococcus sp.]
MPQIQGSAFIPAPPERVWAMLHDLAVLGRCVPGGAQITQEAPDRFRADLNLAVGPLRGNFQASVQLRDQIEPPASSTPSLALIIEAQGPSGLLSAAAAVQLSAEGRGTRADWQGEPRLSGMLAMLAGRLIGKLSQAQTEQFFANLAREAAGGE